MNRRSFFKSLMALYMTKASAAKASDFHFPLPIAAVAAIPNSILPTSFDQEDDSYGHTVIKIIGIGGAGCNAIEHAMQEGIRGVDFIAANTDAHALNRSLASTKLLFGKTDLGAGALPEAGREAVDAHREDIRACLRGTHMAFIMAGMGGGTGSHVAPVVAEIAREMGILTIGVVTKPFSFEGAERMKSAVAGIAKMEKHVDSLVVIQNDKLLDVIGDDVDVDDCFKAADDVLKNAVGGIAEIITCQGLVAVDFEDVRTVMGEMGRAKMGSAAAAGVGRARIAAEQAVASPLLEGVNLSGAKAVLVNITAAKGGLKMKEVSEVMNTVKTLAAEDTQIIFGAVYDEQMGEALRVTLVATGLGLTVEALSKVRRRNVTVETLADRGIERYDIPAFLRKQDV